MTSFAQERQQVADTCRTFADRGYFAGTGGNIGLRLDGQHFAVTPTATDYASMGAGDVVVLRLDTLEQVAGDRRPSVEKGLHQRMLNAYPGRRASVHTHQPIASAVALLREVLPWPEGSDLSRFGRHVGLVPYRPSGTGMLARSLARALRPDLYAYLLASHGVIVAAADLDAAAAMIRWVEAAAAHQLRRRIERRNLAANEVKRAIIETLDKAATQGS